jgi:queuosine precursor transporter
LDVSTGTSVLAVHDPQEPSSRSPARTGRPGGGIAHGWRSANGYNIAPMPWFNELLFIVFLLLDMSLVVLTYRLFGKEGLYGYVVLAIITCNIEVLKQVEMFGMAVTLGNILYGSIFLTADILAEVHGKKAAQKAVWLGFTALLLATLFMQLAIQFVPSTSDQAQPHLAWIFGFMPRVALASLAAYVFSQLLDVTIFMRIKQRMRGRSLWLRNNASTLLSQAVDTVTFTILAFAPLPGIGAVAGFEQWNVIWDIVLTTYIIKLMVSVLDTPFVYWARLVGRKVHPEEFFTENKDYLEA